MAGVKRQAPKRPFALELLSAGFIGLSLFGWLRAGLALHEWQMLAHLSLSIPPLYLVLSGAAWGLVGAAAGSGVWLRRSWAPRAALAAGAFIAASYWIDRLFLAQPARRADGWPFALAVTLAGLAFTAAALAVPSGREYFAGPSSAPAAAGAPRAETITHPSEARDEEERDVV